MSIIIKRYKNKFEYTSNENEIVLTVNIPSDEIKFLFKTSYGREFYAKDEKGINGEDVDKNISNLYKVIKRAIPNKFVSLAVRTDFANAKVCNCYGDVVIVVDKNRISNETIVFNGDVKDIANKIIEMKEKEKWVEIHYMDESDLYENLKRLFKNANLIEQRIPRKIGPYFEARLERSLRADDILEIHVNEDNIGVIDYLESVIK